MPLTGVSHSFPSWVRNSRDIDLLCFSDCFENWLLHCFARAVPGLQELERRPGGWDLREGLLTLPAAPECSHTTKSRWLLTVDAQASRDPVRPGALAEAYVRCLERCVACMKEQLWVRQIELESTTKSSLF